MSEELKKAKEELKEIQQELKESLEYGKILRRKDKIENFLKENK